MPNITSVLNEQIRRLAKREITSQTRSTRRLTAQYRRDIAALKRQVASLQKTVAFLERQEKRRVVEQPVPEMVEGVRFRADGIKSHRAKLGLSAKDYGRLVGVAGLTIYQWEGGKNRPRAAQLAKLIAVRGLGKREALKRLEVLDGTSGKAAAGRPRRSRSGPTAKEFVLSLVRGRNGSAGNEINEACRKSGRPGQSDNTLSRMVKAGELKRMKNDGGRGSKYGAAA